MSWKLKIEFSDGSAEVVDEEFDSREDAEREYDEWLDSWGAGRETLMMAGEDYVDADIVGYDTWEE